MICAVDNSTLPFDKCAAAILNVTDAKSCIDKPNHVFSNSKCVKIETAPDMLIISFVAAIVVMFGTWLAFFFCLWFQQFKTMDWRHWAEAGILTLYGFTLIVCELISERCSVFKAGVMMVLLRCMVYDVYRGQRQAFVCRQLLACVIVLALYAVTSFRAVSLQKNCVIPLDQWTAGEHFFFIDIYSFPCWQQHLVWAGFMLLGMLLMVPIALTSRFHRNSSKQDKKEIENVAMKREMQFESDERILQSVWPKQVLKQIELTGTITAMEHSDCTIMFAYIGGTQCLGETLEKYKELSHIVEILDEKCELYNVEKVKTVGSCYMVASGLPVADKHHAQNMADFAIEFENVIRKENYKLLNEDGQQLYWKIGMDSGKVVAGVIGTSSFIYDVFGDTVNTASRMYSTNDQKCSIQVTPATAKLLEREFEVEPNPKGPKVIKGKRDKMLTSFVRRRKARYPRQEPLMKAPRSSYLRNSFQFDDLVTNRASIAIPFSNPYKAAAAYFMAWTRTESLDPEQRQLRLLELKYRESLYKRAITRIQVWWLIFLGMMIVIGQAFQSAEFDEDPESQQQLVTAGCVYNFVVHPAMAAILYFLTQVDLRGQQSWSETRARYFSPVHMVTLLVIGIGYIAVIAITKNQSRGIMLFITCCFSMIVRGTIHADVLILVLVLLVGYFVTGIVTFAALPFLKWSFFFVVPFLISSSNFDYYVELYNRKVFLDQKAAEQRHIKFEKERKKRDVLLDKTPLPANIRAALGEQNSLNADLLWKDHRASVLFADIVSFTTFSETVTAIKLVKILNTMFKRFDKLAVTHHCSKVKTIGDCYVAASGLRESDGGSPELNLIRMAVGMHNAMTEISNIFKVGLRLRIGIHTGVTYGGIMGKSKLIYDQFGHTVDVANKMEEEGRPEMVLISHKTFCEVTKYSGGHEPFSFRKYKDVVLGEHDHLSTHETIGTYLVLVPRSEYTPRGPGPHEAAMMKIQLQNEYEVMHYGTPREMKVE